MPSNQAERLSELELDALWTIYEGHSLVIEYPQQSDSDPYAHAIMAVAFEDEEAVAEVSEIPLDVAQSLIDAGLLVRSEDGPVLDESSWFDEELGYDIKAEEYILSDAGNAVIEATAEGPAATASGAGEWDDEDDDDGEDEEDDLDGEDDEDEDDWDDEWDEDDEDGEEEDDEGEWDEDEEEDEDDE